MTIEQIPHDTSLCTDPPLYICSVIAEKFIKNFTEHVLTFGHGNTDSICSHDSGEGSETTPVEGGNVGERGIRSCPCHFQLKKKILVYFENSEHT